MKKYTLLFLLLSASAFAQPKKQIQNITQLKDSLQKLMKSERIPGLMMSIVNRDSVLFEGGLGYANVAKKQAVSSKTLFRIGSITKMFVSLGLLKLIEQNKLKLYDEVKQVAPELPIDNNWHSSSPVRVVNLLEHTAGFDDMHFNKIYNLAPTDPRGIDAVKVFQNSLKCRWRPGERMSYSNPGFVVAGYIIEKVARKPYEQYLSETIFRPVGMVNSNLNLRYDPRLDYAQGYEFKNGKYEPIDFLPIYGGADGTLNTCAADMSKYVQLFLNNGKVNGNILFKDSTLNEMEKVHSSLAAKAGLKNGYGLANYVHGHGGKVLFQGHNGGIDGFVSACFYNRALGVGYSLSNNGGKDLHKFEELIEEYLTQNIPKPTLISQKLDTKNIEPFLGYYAFESPRNEIVGFVERLNGKRVSVEGDYLIVKGAVGGDTDTLVQVAPLTFRKKHFNTPNFVFTKNKEEIPVLMKEGTYFEKANVWWTWLRIGLFGIALLFMLSSVFAGFVWTIFAIKKSISTADAWVRILPGGASLCLMIGLGTFLGLTGNISKMSSINFQTILVCLGTAAFGLLTIIGLFLWIKKYEDNKILKIFLTITYLSMLYVAIYLALNGWIGIRTWDL